VPADVDVALPSEQEEARRDHAAGAAERSGSGSHLRCDLPRRYLCGDRSRSRADDGAAPQIRQSRERPQSRRPSAVSSRFERPALPRREEPVLADLELAPTAPGTSSDAPPSVDGLLHPRLKGSIVGRRGAALYGHLGSRPVWRPDVDEGSIDIRLPLDAYSGHARRGCRFRSRPVGRRSCRDRRSSACELRRSASTERVADRVPATTSTRSQVN
jgi:hypothetical protein